MQDLCHQNGKTTICHSIAHQDGGMLRERKLFRRRNHDFEEGIIMCMVLQTAGRGVADIRQDRQIALPQWKPRIGIQILYSLHQAPTIE